MSRTACARAWEAEALVDGRLDSTARASFDRHAATCEACSGERRALARLAQTMRDLPEYPIQTMDRRRARIALLQRANAEIMRGRSTHWRAAVVAAAAVCALAVVAAAARWGGPARVPIAATGVPSFEIVDVGHAVWTKAVEGSVARVALTEGIVSLHVEHLTRDQRFLVDLPDGDLEVRGTRFQVSVLAQHTRHVEVSEGVVALRLRGEPEVVLRAGQEWSAPSSAAPAVSAAAAAPPSSMEPSRLPLAMVSATGLPSTSPQTPTSPSTPNRIPTATQTATAPALASASALATAPDGFASAVRLFESGSYEAADRGLAAFVRDFPSDARGEDAAFLRAVCHARMGDAAGAATISREYLQRYPQGLRRREAERMSAGDGSPRR